MLQSCRSGGSDETDILERQRTQGCAGERFYGLFQGSGCRRVLPSGDKTLHEVTNAIIEGENPDDVLMGNLPMKVEMSLKRLVENDYLHVIEPINQAKQYRIAPKLDSIFKGDDV